MKRSTTFNNSNIPTIFQSALPYLEIDLFIDEVKPYNSTDASGIIPILGRVHSIQPTYKEEKGKRILPNITPFIVGFYAGHKKPNHVHEFLNPLIDELIYFSPNEENVLFNDGRRSFTVCVRFVIADSPRRSYLKICKGHSGYWACDRCIQRGEKI